MKDKELKQQIHKTIEEIIQAQHMNIESIRNGLDCLENAMSFFKTYFEGYFASVPNSEANTLNVRMQDFQPGLTYARSREDEERRI